ncbi:DNA polymerase delta small subunit Cdc1 [Polyrhizophydium stewartii]|uniref:DNA polymerase delta small subunit Cdc1 n=1 Tax=Polyrhizophydium stewartii TaxID=2732419 RepID=A0ABR4ND88_9FUNG
MLRPQAADSTEHSLERRRVRVDRSGAFALASTDLGSQYASLYFTRLNLLRPRVLAAARARWADSLDNPPECVQRILNVQVGVPSYVVGTVFVDMPNKPNILKDIAKEGWTVFPEARETYTSDNDTVLLEDESGRIALTGEIVRTTVFVTGIVIGLLGYETEDGEFHVLDVCYPSFEPQPSMPAAPTQADEHGPWVALVSGLNLGSQGHMDMRHELLLDFLTGESGTAKDQRAASQIAHVLVCGNLMAPMQKPLDPRSRGRSKPAVLHGGVGRATQAPGQTPAGAGSNSGTEPAGQASASASTEAAMGGFDPLSIATADTFLAELSASIPVDVMPGPSDPTTSFLPQRPIHASLFHQASRASSLHMLPNPCALAVDGVMFLGEAGQVLDDLGRSTRVARGLELASEVLKWGHLAPTAPDTLWCAPFTDTDPLVIGTRPHVLFVGNQPRFETALVELPAAGGGHALSQPDESQQARAGRKEATRVVLVPSFAATGTIVMLHLRTLQTKTVEFGTAL